MMLDIIHHMGRRCRDWDYGGRAIYMITVNLKERGRPVLAEWPQFLPVSGQFCVSPETAKFCPAHFSATGNAALLRWPVILQVQCSRADFRYRRVRLATGGWKILRNAAGEPLVEYASPAFEAKCEDALRCAKNGAALISPCISHGEREIARRAHIAGARVIALCNKGFSKFEKPNGALFDQCAKGNLLMLAPAAWPYVPGEKPPTRESSLVLNRIAQLMAGDEAEVKYRGVVFSDIDAKMREALRPQEGTP